MIENIHQPHIGANDHVISIHRPSHDGNIHLPPLLSAPLYPLSEPGRGVPPDSFPVQLSGRSKGGSRAVRRLSVCRRHRYPCRTIRQKRLSICDDPDAKRDEFELALLQAALDAQKPIFCIGRGMQLLNVALGGTLIQSIRFYQEYQHADPLHRSTATHPVDLDPESLLSWILDTDTLAVNSLHHQAVDDLGKGLLISADSPEGFPEGLELAGYPFCLAVQWHPEYMAPRTPAQQKLFQAFTDACR